MMRDFRRRMAFLPLLLGSAGLSLPACGDEGPAGPEPGSSYRITFQGLAALPADQGTLRVWLGVDGDPVPVATLPSGTGAVDPVSFQVPEGVGEVRSVFITVEPPLDTDPEPSASVLMAGPFSGSRARLVIENSVTNLLPLQPEPGAHSLFTTSNNYLGYPSAENAGLWLFTLTPSRNAHGTREVKVTPLLPGWVYEGWIVWQGEPEVWISYGKFRPDEFGLLSSRDDTGSGPFAGTEDYRNAGVEDVPGEEWTSDEIAGELGIPLPGDFTLPLALDSVGPDGEALWRHVITVEPAFDLVEGPLEGKPFVIRPYANEIGPGGPGVPRTIRFVEDPPTAEVRRITDS